MTGIYSLLEGKTLSGRYQIGRLISKGGMGAVFRATDSRLGRSVAVKVIAIEPESAEQAASLRARFRREAHAAARLRHPHIVTLHDFGSDEATGLDFIVMELLEGEDLLRRVSRTGPLSWRQASRILYEAARGLGAGHKAGLVHRDVKSANLFLECDAAGNPQCTRVLDFGIAQLKFEGTATATHLTVLGHAPLSPAYASPEQQRGERELTPAADVWGLGVTAFQILTGSLPFSDAQRAVLATGGRVQPPSVASLNPTVPPAADELIRRALSVQPAERPLDGDTFAREISAIRRASRAAAGHERQYAPGPNSGTGELGSATTTTNIPRGGRNWTVGALVVAGGVIVLLASQATNVPAGSPAGSAANSFASSPPAPSHAATEYEISYIRQVYQRIEAGGQEFRTWQLGLGPLARREWPSADSVFALVYDNGAGVQKIRVRVYEDGVRRSLLLYYDAGSLVFIHEVTRPFGATSNLEQRFYFRDRALIRWRDTGNTIVPLGSAYDEYARTFLRMSDALMALATGTAR